LPVSAADLKALSSEAGAALRSAEREIFSGKAETARSNLDSAAASIEKIKAQDPNFAGLKSLEAKYHKLTKDIEKRTGVGAQPPRAQREDRATGSSSSAKLPGGVTHRLKHMERILDKGEGLIKKQGVESVDWKIKELEATLKEAQGVMDEIEKGYGSQIPEGHPEIKAALSRLEAFRKDVGTFKVEAAAAGDKAKDAKERSEKDSGKWLARIRPFIAGLGQQGHDPARYLVAGATEDVNELARRKKIFDEAREVYEQYQKASFEYGRSDELERAADSLAYSIKTFKESFDAMKERCVAETISKIGEAKRWLDQEAAKDDGKRLPLVLQEDVVERIKALFALTASIAPEDGRIKDMERDISEIEKKDKGLREIRIKRTFMKPEAFKAPELNQIRESAGLFLKKAKPDAVILRTNVISDEWKEERVLEHTDTTKTALRHRITRDVTVQVAAKTAEGVHLYTLNVAKDQRSDGTWGPLYGHVMHSDPMLEENVSR
jgi:hypothetical protein